MTFPRTSMLRALAAGFAMMATSAGAQTVIGDDVLFDRAPTQAELRAIFGIQDPPKDTVRKSSIYRGLTRGVVHLDQQGQPIATQKPKRQAKRNTTRKPTKRHVVRHPDPKLPPLTGKRLNVEMNFTLDSAELLLRDAEKLASLGKFLETNKSLRFLVAGHADSSGPRHYNFKLSDRRAKSVRAYLLGNFDIAPDRLVSAGYGEIAPLRGIPTTDGRNRRVEFRAIGNTGTPETPAQGAS